MSVISNNILAGAAGQAGGAAAGYEIERSLRFNSADSAYLNRTPSSAGNRRTWTWSGWVKLTNSTQANIFTGGTNNQNDFAIRIENGMLSAQEYSGSWKWRVKTTALHRDFSAWYHFVVAFDSTQSTSSDRIKIYVNGAQQTSFSTSEYPSQNFESLVNKADPQYFAYSPAYSYSSFYLAETHFIDGQALAPTDFGELDDNGVWQPIRYTFGTNPNNGTTWSSNIVADASGFQSGFGADKMFDGNTSTYGQGNSGTNPSTLTFTPPSPIAFTDKVEIWHVASDSSISAGINGGSKSSISDGSWQTVASGGGTLTTLDISRSTSGGASLVGVRIDGRVLIDGADDNSFHLDFSDNSSAAALGTDSSTNNNDWTVNNITASEYSVSDAPTLSNGAMIVRGASGSVTVTISGDGNKNYFTSTDGSDWTHQSTNTSATYTANYIAAGGAGTNLRTAVSAGVFQYAMWNTNTDFDSTSNTTTDTTGLTFVNTTNNGANVDSLFDSPTNGTQADTGAGGEVSGNYCTMNPNDPTDRGTNFGANVTLSNGNLDVFSSGSVDMNVVGTIGVKTGKYYWEATWNVAQLYGALGVISETYTKQRYRQDGNFVSGSATFTSGDIIGMALDLDSATKTIAFYKNGVSQGSLTLSGDVRWFPLLEQNGGTGRDAGAYFNFGQRAFAYTAPSGYKALCTTNLDDPTLADGSTAMDVVAYTGDGEPSRAFTGLNHNPGFLWVKSRGAARPHNLQDIVRGAGNYLISNLTNAEGTGLTDGLISFDTGGFTIGNNAVYNNSSEAYVGWTWDAGDLYTTSSSSYNQTQTWSNHLTTSSSFQLPATNAFDSNLHTKAEDNNNQNTMTFDVSSYTLSGVVRVYTPAIDPNNVFEIAANGGTAVTTASNAAQWTSLGNIADLDTITVTAPSSNPDNIKAAISAIEVDGKILIDPGINPAGSIASTVRANPSAGFSICSYTGTGSNATFGHGLNAAPSLVIVKCRSQAQNWAVQHSALGPTYYLYLQSTNAASTTSSGPFWNSTAPTNTTVSVGTDNDTNASSKTYISYCFAPVEGYSAFGSYTGNGSSTDGPFIYTGFRPAFVMIKSSSTSNAYTNWDINDNARSPFNVSDETLAANISDLENSTNIGNQKIDLVSNGFKIRQQTSSSKNISGETYIYACFAENPFKHARAR